MAVPLSHATQDERELAVGFRSRDGLFPDGLTRQAGAPALVCNPLNGAAHAIVGKGAQLSPDTGLLIRASAVTSCARRIRNVARVRLAQPWSELDGSVNFLRL